MCDPGLRVHLVQTVSEYVGHDLRPSLEGTVMKEAVPLDVVSCLKPLLDPSVRLSIGPNIPRNTDVLVASHPSQQQLASLTKLRVLIIPYTGVPEETRDIMLEFPAVSVHNLHHNASNVAELALALLLAAAKKILIADKALRVNDWRPRYDQNITFLLEGKTALVLGLGNIGLRVARICTALGMRVLATDRDVERPRPMEIPVEIYPPEDLLTLLPDANILLITLPLTPETRNLIGHQELSLLPTGAILVNVARGAIIDEAALYEALCSGKLFAAGIDTWNTLPKDYASSASTSPSRYPFHRLENVVMSPHRGGRLGFEEGKRFAEELAMLVNAAAKGMPIPNRVDLRHGY